jgi:alpha-amylase
VRPLTLVLIVHDHQPIGNFDGVFQQSYDEAYAPFLNFLETHPRIRIGLHTSGPLLLWIAERQRGYLDRLRRLVARNQVELWGGGFFEPVLASIPETDRRGQIHAMADWLERELGMRPRGAWLTERVWEPGLASSLASAGVEYVAVDDAHFIAAGLPRDRLWGTYLTEDQGIPIRVFPIHRELRYAIPFGEPEDTVEILERVARGGDGRVAVLGDDGEKFGVWPGTHALCYERGWLDRFAAALDASPWIEIRTPAEAIAHHAALGLTYLPTASYHEMQEWALPPEAQERYHRAAERLEPMFGDETHDLLRGGTWRNFQARYPEANRPHKRMQRASKLMWARADAESKPWKRALTRLWRSQCNDAYWHGVFGGLYLPHLRGAIYRELIEVERFLGDGTARIERGDVDLDGHEDVLLENADWAAWVSARGGAMWAFDDRARGWNAGDTLARRPEYYHRRLKDAVLGGGEGETIHSALRLKEPGLEKLIEHYDARGRESFLESWEENGRCHDWALQRFALDMDGEDAILARAAEGDAPALEKRYARGSDGALEVQLTLRSARARRGAFVLELNLGLHVPRANDRFVEIGGVRAEPSHFGARACHERVTDLAFVDAWANRRLALTLDREAALERAPIETVSLSEAGAERVFQGVELRFRFTPVLEPGNAWRLRVRLLPGAAMNAAEAGRT